MASNYSSSSPWANTEQTWYLSYYKNNKFLPSSTDNWFKIPLSMKEQPWKLSYKLYNNEKLYYIFALLNPDILVDPIYDFQENIIIRVPTQDRVNKFIQRNGG